MTVNSFDHRIAAIAAKQYNVVDRSDVQRARGTDHHIAVRVGSHRWQQLHAGVYLIGAAEATWEQRVFAGVRACGTGAVTAGTGLALYGVGSTSKMCISAARQRSQGSVRRLPPAPSTRPRF